MIKKFEDNFEFHPSIVFDIMESVPGHFIDVTEKERQHKFKRDLMDNISIIAEKNEKKDKKDKKPVERLNTVG